MSTGVVSAVVTAGMTLLLAACSGGSAPATTTASNAKTASPASSASSAQPPTPGNPTAVSGTAVPSTGPAGGGGGTTIGSMDPCSLLTQAEVDTAVGQPLGPGKSAIPHYDCDWATSDFAAGVSITVSDWPAIKTAATANGHAPTPVAGVGDEALYKGGGLLYVRKGDAGFLLVINGPHVDSLPDGGLAQEKVLAAAVLGRL